MKAEMHDAPCGNSENIQQELQQPLSLESGDVPVRSSPEWWVMAAHW
jgi:hypothetical protein